MASQGPNIGLVGENDNAFGLTGWLSPNNAGASDDVYATVQLSSAQTSQYLKVTDFGFSIPGGSTIDGIVVEFEKKSANGNVSDTHVHIVKGGTVGATERAAAGAWSTTEGWVSYGSSTDLWGETWTASDINASNFGAVIAAIGGIITDTASVDAVRITVYYSAAPGKSNIYHITAKPANFTHLRR